MKQLLLSLLLTLAATGLATAQNIVWEEDFSDGMVGWRVNPITCGNNAGATYGNNSGPEYGIWSLTSGTYFGEEVEVLPSDVFEWSFINAKEYSVVFYDETLDFYGTVYATYSIDENNVMTSSIDPAQVVADGTAFSERTANGIVDWATNLNVEDVASVIDAIGVGSPTIVFSNGGNTMTYTGAGGEVVLVYTKRTECGTLWTWSPNGNLGYGVAGQNPGVAIVNSTTRTNGVMVMNNIYQMTQGSPLPSPNPPPYPHYVAELISPPIDISAATRALSVTLTQRMAYLNTPTDAPDGLKTSFSISTDDGLTWSPASDVNPSFPTNTIRSNTITAPILNAYTEGATSIRIKFTFATDYYYWGIDDIIIRERVGYEMQANANFYAIADNANTPFSQLQPLNFLADIQNNGGLTAENVNLNLTIVNGEGNEVYNQDNFYGNITPDSLAENSIFNIDEPLDLPRDAASVGSYFGRYILSHDQPDSNPLNDTLSFSFAVTDTLFAKETGRTRGIFLTNNNSWYIGNSYYVPVGETWYARWISFMVDDATANAGKSVTTLLYESDGDVDGDGRINPEEYNFAPYAFNEYLLAGTENQQLITIPVDLEGEGKVLTSGKYYLAVIQYVGDAATDRLAISASEQYNYAANNFVTDSLGIEQYSDIVDLVAEEPNFFSGGFGGTVVPLVRLHIGDNPDLTAPGITLVNTDEELPAEYAVTVFPNPAKDDFSVALAFPQPTNVLARFYDQTGRILSTQRYDQLSEGRFSYDVRQLASGIYFLQLDTPAGIRIEKVVVQH